MLSNAPHTHVADVVGPTAQQTYCTVNSTCHSPHSLLLSLWHLTSFPSLKCILLYCLSSAAAAAAAAPPPAHTQEGWHLELDDPSDPLTYKGVVFNEMKGVYSSPDSMFYRTVQQVRGCGWGEGGAGLRVMGGGGAGQESLKCLTAVLVDTCACIVHR
jgi:hypothetical protein